MDFVLTACCNLLTESILGTRNMRTVQWDSHGGMISKFWGKDWDT